MSDLTIKGSTHHLLNFPNKCPHCQQRIIPVVIAGHKQKLGKVEIFMNCPDSQCQRSFIGFYNVQTGNNSLWSGITSIGTLDKRHFHESIVKISASFIVIYNEALQAEQHNLLEICGVGYRKALEFLIKDYAVLKNPDKEDAIKSKLLGLVIKDYVNDERVKMVSKRAVWLGNDETHYVRKWSGKDLNDLKSLIDLTVHWIEMEELTKAMIDDMPE